MNQPGDAYGQPGESVESLSDIADMMGDDTPETEETLEAEDSEEPEASEVEEADEPSDDEDDAGEPTFTIKHDGKDVALKQSELVEMAQKGFDYTRKTMEVAEQRKAVDAERDHVASLRQHHEQALQEQAGRLNAFAQFMEAQLGQPPHISLAQHDPAAYLAEKELYEARRGQLHEAYAALDRNQQEQARQRHAWIAETAAQTEKALRDTLPGWNDNTLDELAAYGRTLGLSPDALPPEAFVTKGLWEALHKARQYDELQARKATLKPKTELPKVAKPSASKQTPRGIVAQQEAEKRYRTKPSIDTIADLL